MNHNVIQKKLSNGIRLIVVPQKGNTATTLAVFVEAGSKYEEKKLNGISHFLEHMCFKGTEKRPKPIIIAQELEGLGAEYNAFTAEEYTGYYAKVKNESFHNALDIITDMYLNPVINTEELEREKGVIIEEINMYEDIPPRKVPEIFMQTLYGDQPAGWSIAGKKEVVQKVTREDFITYRSQHYVPSATTIAIAGGANFKHIEKKLESIFSGMKKGKKVEKKPVRELQGKPREMVSFKESDQTHFMMGFRAFDMYDKRRFTLQVLADILGGGMASRLFIRVREQLGAAYYVNAFPNLYTDHGYIAMSAGVNHEKLRAVISASLEEFDRMKKELVTKEELERAKEHLIGNFYLSIETSDQLCMYYGMQTLMKGGVYSPEMIAKKIRAVKAGDIQKLARELFINKSLNLALVGPYKDKTFSDILKI
ncbi:insulinase family protein [Candidatus Parcubacteria bacterium]|jgi:predicted Zn-dependent peptidase|nr:MAG: insulinase family protein [Candidatus Parcubacteria bacterium]